jgi:general secretion pathway protein I
MRGARDGRYGNRGFTMIEVMVALVILLIALGVLFSGIASSLGTARSTAAWSRAISRAESHLTEITDPSLVLGEREGEDGEGYRWRTRVAFLGAARAPRAARGGPWARGTGLYAVSVTIFWHEGRAEQSFELDSARLGPVSVSGP